MDVEVLPSVVAVIDGISTKRHVPDNEVKTVIRERRLFKAFHLNVRIGIKFLCEFTRNAVKFHTV